MRDGHQSRIIVLQPAPPKSTDNAAGLPLLLMFHGGGHCVGHPESEIPLLRLVTTYDIISIAPSYRLAPEYPFPCSINDAWDVIYWAAAAAASTSPDPTSPLAFAKAT